MSDVLQNPDWLKLPAEVVLSVSRLLPYADYLRFRAATPIWLSILPCRPPNFPTQFPWILYPPPLDHTPKDICNTDFDSTDHSLRRHALYDVSSGKIHFLLDDFKHCRVVGSSYGFLIVLDVSLDIFCYNPISKSKVFLPPMSVNTFPGVMHSQSAMPFSFILGYTHMIRHSPGENPHHVTLRDIQNGFVRKAILTASPSSGNSFYALAITSFSRTTKLAYCEFGDTRWKPIPCGNFDGRDIIYRHEQGLFYSVNDKGHVATFSPDNPESFSIIRNKEALEGRSRYLVEGANGELLLVTRSLEGNQFNNGKGIYRFHQVGNKRVHWESMTSLDDQILFRGGDSTLTLSSIDFPGWKGNHIYHPDYPSRSSKVMVYDIANDSTDELPLCPSPSNLPESFYIPTWFTPSPV